LERLIQGEYRLIWRLLRRLGVAVHSVDDATQQVFLVVAERLDDIQLESERAFAFGTALRVAQSLRRKHGREQSDGDPDARAALSSATDELAEQRRLRERLDLILELMPIELRSVFVLFEIEGLTSPEIAELSDLPLGTVASRLRRAREQFRTLVAQRAWTSVTVRAEP
jgi:RNA polymerase sigma-70 factor (ECF subfamily)